MDVVEQQKKRLDLAVQTRNFEIELFWKRSLFFWGFIAAAFAGYASLHSSNHGLATAIGSFGMVCSFAWALVTRGSKYWQEGWESKVDESELPLIGHFFAIEMKPQTHKGFWLRSRKFSVSKISIALSDYVLLMWICLMGVDLGRHYATPDVQVTVQTWAPVVFVILSLVFMLLLVRTSGTSKRPDQSEVDLSQTPPTPAVYPEIDEGQPKVDQIAFASTTNLPEKI